MTRSPFTRQHQQGERGEELRPSDPDTLPDSEDPAGPCPRCGRTSNFRSIGSLPVSFDGTYLLEPNGQQSARHVDQVSVLVCSGCRQGVVVVEEQWVGDTPVRLGGRGGTVRWRGVHWWPTPGATGLGGDIPDAVRLAYDEGVRCLSAGAPHAAVVMFRRTLEAIVADVGSEAAKAQKTLDRALLQMAADGRLDENLAQWAKEIRLVGNAGGHYDPLADVDAAEAEDLARLCRALLNYLYELPAQIRRARGTQPQAGNS